MRSRAAAGAVALLAGCGVLPGRGSAPAPSPGPLLACAATEVAALGYALVEAPRRIEDGFTAEKYLPPADTDTRTRGLLQVWTTRDGDGYRLTVHGQRYAEGQGTTQAVGRPRSVPGGPIPLPPGGPVTGPRIPGDPRGPVTAGTWRRIPAGPVGRDANTVRDACKDGVPDDAPPREAPGPAPTAPGREAKTAA